MTNTIEQNSTKAEEAHEELKPEIIGRHVQLGWIAYDGQLYSPEEYEIKPRTPAVDVSKLYLNEQNGGIGIARAQGVNCARSYNKAIDHLASNGYLRRDNSEALRRFDYIISRADHDANGVNIGNIVPAYLRHCDVKTIRKALDCGGERSAGRLNKTEGR